jgi:hypothetical protein
MATNYLEKLPKPDRAGVNLGLTSPTSSFMINFLGQPRTSYTGDCQNPSEPAFQRLVETRDVGPIRVTGLKAALDSLTRVFADVKAELPDLYDMIDSAGMLCCRYKRISGRVVEDPSNHSFGAAVDLKLGGVLDAQGDNKTLRGLLILSKYFNAHGWYWGVSFPTEDAMHFEVARETLIRWRDVGWL